MMSPVITTCGEMEGRRATKLATARIPAATPKAMKVEYLTKAETGLRAVARLDPLPDYAAIVEGRDVAVPISIYDKHSREVVHAEITTWVTPRQ